MNPRPPLPRWAEVLRQRYLAGEASTFVLYRNVFDRCLLGDTLLSLGDFLLEALFRDTKQQVCEVSLERGLRLLSGRSEEAMRALGLDRPEDERPGLLATLHALEQRMREPASSTAVIVPYADALLPAGDPAFMAHADRQLHLVFHRWSLDDVLTRGDNIVVLITESLNALNPSLLSNPKVAVIEVPMPDLELRQRVIGHFAPRLDAHPCALLAQRTSGLRTVQLASILAGTQGQGMDEDERRQLIAQLLEGTPEAQARAHTLAAITAGMSPAEITRLIEPGRLLPPGNAEQELLQVIHARKREMIEKECAGLIEFIEPRHGLSAVGGQEALKRELMTIARHLKQGERTLTPMGLLAVGPMGSGKTFVIKAFLKEAGLSAVALTNFRSKWVGATEANLERVLATVQAMGPIALVIDEGDRSFGAGGEDSDGGTSARVIARLKAFMAEPENRGQVLFVLMTNRPDRLDTDLKRPGRLDRKLPFFYAETATERLQVLRAVLGRYGETCDLPEDALQARCEALTGYSNADLEALALLAVGMARERGSKLDMAALDEAIDDFMPPQEQDMIEFMELLAVSEASRRSLLPERHRGLSPADLQDRLQAARRRALAR